MEEKCILNIVNLKIKNSNIVIELMLDRIDINQDIQISMEDKKNQKYFGTILKSKNGIKSIITIPLLEDEEYIFKVQKENNEYIASLLNNKNKVISEEGNQYVIFYQKRRIQVLENNIVVSSKKIFQKLQYECFKIKYGIKKYKKLYLLRLFKTKNKYYLFSDRLMYADDNAEELFRYINKTDRNFAKRCYFVLDKNSKKFNELKKVGNVLIFGSLKHKIKFINAEAVISSHSSYFNNMFTPFNKGEMQIYKDIITKQFVFLQHGITMNDVSNYLNREHIIADLFITSLKCEYEDIKTDKYLYNENQVLCTGLPRFDKLIDKSEKMILIAPTWRTTITEKVDIEQTEYYKRYKELLEDEQLKQKVTNNNYKILFLVHPAFDIYKEQFEKLKNDYTDIIIANEINYSELFNRCSIFITDYSSTHFDVATLQKPIIYYQFDKAEFFEKHYHSGYFSYEDDGFGDVIESKNDLTDKICYYIENGSKIEEKYIDRIKTQFEHVDKDNSRRVYTEIIKLSKENELNYRFNDIH